ncbi:MAG: BrnA antitoxin family protein [Pseudomonadota bacterium]
MRHGDSHSRFRCSCAELNRRAFRHHSPERRRITIRLSPDTLEKCKAAGPGWQMRLDAALADWLLCDS